GVLRSGAGAMKDNIIVETDSRPPLSLRSINLSDIETLRVWKNANKHAFFFKSDITPEMQQQWFEGYCSRPDDCMFVVESSGAYAGCMGFRLLENGEVDCYNIMGNPDGRAKGVMAAAMRLMCSYI